MFPFPSPLLTVTQAGGASLPDLSGLGLSGWWDAADLSTLFKNSAGTTPVTADGDETQLMVDKTGNGRNFGRTTSTSIPLYKTDGTKHWLYFDGVNDQMDGTSGSTTHANLFTSTEFELAVAGRYVAVTTNISPNYPNNDAFFEDLNGYGGIAARSTGEIGGHTYDGNQDIAADSYTIGTDFIAILTKQGGNLTLRLNNNTPVTVAAGATSVTSNRMLLAKGTASNWSEMRFYAALTRKTAFNSTERADVQTYLAARAGVSL